MLISFFLPWVAWKGINVAGYLLPAGKFFALSESNFKLGNPFPQLAFSFAIFWLIPVLIIIAVNGAIQNKKITIPAFIAGALMLSLLTVYYLFSNTLADLGVGEGALGMMRPAAFAAAAASILLILSAQPVSVWLKKSFWIIIGPVLALAAYKIGEKQVMGETFQQTAEVNADYTVSATDLLREFAANDTAANTKYREKIMVVNGTATQVEQRGDSTTTIQLVDSTGSYVVFSFDKEQYEAVKNIKTGDAVSLKGSCSGSVYSEILGTTVISFKRSTLHKD